MTLFEQNGSSVRGPCLYVCWSQLYSCFMNTCRKASRVPSTCREPSSKSKGFIVVSWRTTAMEKGCDPPFLGRAPGPLSYDLLCKLIWRYSRNHLLQSPPITQTNRIHRVRNQQKPTSMKPSWTLTAQAAFLRAWRAAAWRNPRPPSTFCRLGLRD